MKKIIALSLLYLMSTQILAADRPNILVILTDDMGFSDLGCFGGEIATPHLDKLAQSGLRFTNFYNTARCWPTRATLMSGTYCDDIKGRVTVAQIMKKAAYQTAIAGKWHLGKDPKVDGPLQKGFEDFYGTMNGAGSFYDPKSLVRNDTFIEADSKDYYYTDKIGSEAVRQINYFAKSDKPFFHFVAFTAAHWPLHAPEKTIQKYIKRYEGGWDKMRQERYQRMLKMGIINKELWPMPPKHHRAQAWQDVENKAYQTRNMAIYAAMVDHMDQAVGKIVAALKHTKQFENTMIIYFHDNGASPESIANNAWGTATNVLHKARQQGKKLQVGNDPTIPNGGPMTYGTVGPGWARAQNTPLRRFKTNVHNGGSNTPAIVHWPAGLKTKPGSITNERGHVVDILATSLDLAGVDYPSQWQGKELKPHESKSLVPIFKGQKNDRNHAYYFNHKNTFALIKGKYKIIREGGRPWALYNLQENRTETENLAKQYPEVVKTLAAIWEHKRNRQR